MPFIKWLMMKWTSLITALFGPYRSESCSCDILSGDVCPFCRKQIQK